MRSVDLKKLGAVQSVRVERHELRNRVHCRPLKMGVSALVCVCPVSATFFSTRS